MAAAVFLGILDAVELKYRPLFLVTVPDGSLFDGSGGFPLGGLLAGVTPVWASEIEPFPISAFSTTQIPYLLFLSMVWGEEKLLADYEIGKKIVPADFQLPETLNWSGPRRSSRSPSG